MVMVVMAGMAAMAGVATAGMEVIGATIMDGVVGVGEA
jgi:hypothetical protein